MRLGVDTHGSNLVESGHGGAPVTLAVGEAADDAVGPARFALVPLENRHRRTPSSPSASRAQYRTVMNSLRRLATDLAISGSSSGSGASSGGSVYISAAASACPSPGSTPESSVAITVTTAWP